MVLSDNILGWLTPFADVIPRSDEPLFTELWGNSRFSYNTSKSLIDQVDLWSAKTVCAAMYLNKPLLIVLPDRSPQRAPILFASCLVMDALDGMFFQDSEHHKVIYFGTSVGIREQLSSVSVGDLYLDTVFPMYKTLRGHNAAVAIKVSGKRHKGRSNKNLLSSLPHVICAYSPADPRAIIDKFEPTWLALDCSDTHEVSWLPAVLEYASRLDLPVVAWCQNPLGTTVDTFRRHGGLVFKWGQLNSIPTPRTGNSSKENPSLLKPNSLVSAHPELTNELEKATAALLDASKTAKQDQILMNDALKIGWRYLQALELLPVPLNLYEAEVSKFWGGTPIARIRAALERFFEEIQIEETSNDQQHLARALEALIKAHDSLKEVEPPYWSFILSLAMSNPYSHNVILVFSSEYRKQLTIFGLLSRANISEEDLRNKGIWLTTYKELYRTFAAQETRRFISPDTADVEPLSVPLNKPFIPILFGVPSVSQTPYLEPIFRENELHFVIYDYQSQLLFNRANAWNRSLMHNPAQLIEVLGQLTPNKFDSISSPMPQNILQVVGIEAISIKINKLEQPTSTERLLEPLDIVDEISKLFELEEESELDFVTLDDSEIGSQNEGNLWIENQIYLEFDDGWCVSFSPDDTVQVVVAGGETHTQERFVRSIRPGDRILFIVGQQRQNLYDLIISRVHAHPAIEVHLAMIRRWHEEFPRAYKGWRKRNENNLTTLLSLMQLEGSQVTSTQTLRQWLTGSVLCPEDSNDLQRLAKILNIPFLSDNFKQIAKAAGRLGGIHRALSRRLNRWLNQEAFGAIGEVEVDTTVLDKELGLTFNDFRDSLIVLTVTSSTQRQGLFLRQGMGKLLRKG
ncbi:MAG: hypothetical protein IAE89_13700 [Anaerolineae bacterium]|nr:hypothetical protein [Anaerolineae bacterium]